MSASPASMRYRAAAAATFAKTHVLRESTPAYGEDDDNNGIPDAAAVHQLLKSLHALGNEVRLALLDALMTLHRGKLFVELGYSSFSQYCDRELGLAHSTAYEYVRAGMALAGLPQLRAFFKDGELSWHQVRNIVLVAKPHTGAAWIQLAVEAPVRERIAEVREAKRTGRSAPRDRRHGLPNLLVRLSVDLTLEEKERVRAAFALVREALDDGPGPEDEGPGLPGAAGDRRPELVRWADGVLSGAIPVAPVVAHATAGDAGPDSDSGSAPPRPGPPGPGPPRRFCITPAPSPARQPSRPRTAS